MGRPALILLALAGCAPAAAPPAPPPAERLVFHAPVGWPLPATCLPISREPAAPGHVVIVADCRGLPPGDG